MQIISDFQQDVQTRKSVSGAYEWWYFDAMDASDKFKFVIIFYEGNPFSPRYIQDKHALARSYPAVSISVYEGSRTIFYSFTEYASDACEFNSEIPEVRAGNHELKGYQKSGLMIYELKLEESLPSGNSIAGKLSFISKMHSDCLFDTIIKREKSNHIWNLVQPCATVRGRIELTEPDKETYSIDFSGEGYHDHNTGMEPLKEEFKEWYWGRFHFPEYTLVYYLMNKKRTQQHKGLLIDNDRQKVCDTFDQFILRDKALSLFGLNSARKICMKNENMELTIQHSSILDNGPFYQRFGSEAFLLMNSAGSLQRATGISEYIAPERISWKIFRPLINMRIMNKNGRIHWVQKSNKFYRWTW